jgi:hypothetical protein
MSTKENTDTPRTDAARETGSFFRAIECAERLERELANAMRVINDPHAMHAHYLRIGNGWEVWTSERVRGYERRIEELERELVTQKSPQFPRGG